MDKKELSVSLIVIGLTALFVFASFVLFLSRGRSKFWTAKKMKLGAMLLTFTAAANLSSCDGGDGEVMCYAQAQLENWVRIETPADSIDLNKTNIIEGRIEYRLSDVYSFTLKKENDTAFKMHELLEAKDGTYNDSTEFFTLQLDTNLTSGKYTLSFYDTGLDSIGWSIADYHFNIKNE